MNARFEVDEVRASLTARAVLEFYGWQFRASGDELESSACPTRSDHSRRAFVINSKSGRWQCFPCGTSGDLFDFVAAAERLSMPSAFGAVLAKAAEIAGVGPSTLSADERRHRREEWILRAAEHERQEREQRRVRDLSAVPIATAYWASLPTEHPRGLAYLEERGLAEPTKLAQTVRFDPKHAGSPAIALFSREGEIRNVVARRVPELGEPKTPGLYQCPSAGTFVNAVRDIEAGRDVVLTEGVMDSLTARLAWDGATILGAHGAANLPKVARIAAPAIAKAQTRMIVVAHRDSRGFDCAVDACRFAVEAGLSIRRGTLQILKHGEKDLNDAWRRGWRPSA
jgi:hypothetical protein